jgi:hypothetical protein
MPVANQESTSWWRITPTHEHLSVSFALERFLVKDAENGKVALEQIERYGRVWH